MIQCVGQGTVGQGTVPCPINPVGQGTVNACEGYKMATSKFLPSLVHFVRGFAAWAFLVFLGKVTVLMILMVL